MVKEVGSSSKGIFQLRSDIASSVFGWLAGFFAFAATLGLLHHYFPNLLSNGLRRYIYQIFLLIAVARLFWQGWRPVLNWKPRFWLITLASLAVYFIGLFILNSLCKSDDDPVATFASHFGNFEEIFLLAVAAPLLEELFFRDLLMRSLLLRKIRVWIVVLISSAFFMVAHQSFHLGAFLLGAANGCLYYFSRSVVGPVLFHSISNLSWFFLPLWFPHFFQKLIAGNLLHYFYK